MRESIFREKRPTAEKVECLNSHKCAAIYNWGKGVESAFIFLCVFFQAERHYCNSGIDQQISEFSEGLFKVLF